MTYTKNVSLFYLIHLIIYVQLFSFVDITLNLFEVEKVDKRCTWIFFFCTFFSNGHRPQTVTFNNSCQNITMLPLIFLELNETATVYFHI